MNNKIIIDNQFTTNKRGIYGIFIVSSIEEKDEKCVYIGKSEELSRRVKNHCTKIQNKTHVKSLNYAMDNIESKIEIRLVESVLYVFDNYYKDAQRLASRENYWIDKYQAVDQCLEQVPEGKRPSIDWWIKSKLQQNK